MSYPQPATAIQLEFRCSNMDLERAVGQLPTVLEKSSIRPKMFTGRGEGETAGYPKQR